MNTQKVWKQPNNNIHFEENWERSDEWLNIARPKGKQSCRTEIWVDSFRKTGAVPAVGKLETFRKLVNRTPARQALWSLFSYLSYQCLVIYTTRSS